MPPFTDLPKHDVNIDVSPVADNKIGLSDSSLESQIDRISKTGSVASVSFDCRTCTTDVSDETRSGKESSTCWSTTNEESSHGAHGVYQTRQGLRDLEQSLHGESSDDITEKVADFYNQKGTMHFRRDNLRGAESSYNSALRLYRKAFSQCRNKSSGKRNCKIKLLLAISATLSNISAVSLRKGNKGAAAAYLEQALKIQERVVNARREHVGISVEMAQTLYNLGITESSRGNYNKALGLLTRAKNIIKSLYGPFHIELAQIVDAIGALHELQNHTEDALGCHYHALQIKTAILCEHHPSVLRSMMDIANMHRRLGELDQAEDMYRERLTKQENALQRALDPQYRRAIRADLAITMRWIAKVQRQRGYLDCIMPTITEEQDTEKVEVTDEGVEIVIVV